MADNDSRDYARRVRYQKRRSQVRAVTQRGPLLEVQRLSDQTLWQLAEHMAGELADRSARGTNVEAAVEAQKLHAIVLELRLRGTQLSFGM